MRPMRCTRLSLTRAIVAMGPLVFGFVVGVPRTALGQRITQATRPAPVWQLPKPFTLARFVPADVCLYVHLVRNPERDPLRARYQQFWQYLWAAKPADAFKGMLSASIAPEGRATFEQAWQRVTDRFGAIDWDALTRDEVVVLGRMKGLTPELMIMFRVPPDATARHGKALRSLVEAAAALDGDLQVIPLDVQGAQTVILASGQYPSCVQVGWRNGLVVLCYGPRPPELMHDVLAWSAGAATGRRLVDGVRLKDVLAGLPKPEDDLAFVDVQLAVRQVLGTDATVTRAGRTDPEGMIRRLVGLLDVYDHWVSVGWTVGRRQLHVSQTVLAADASGKPLHAVVARQPRFKRFDRFVPDTASGFRLWSGVDLAALHDVVLEVLRRGAADPDQFTTDWQALQKDLGLSFREDLFEWLDGRAMLVSVPMTADPGSGSDPVLLLGVREGAQAGAKVARLVDWLRGVLTQGERPPPLESATVGGAPFKRLVLQSDPPATGLVFGVAHGWLIISTSSSAVERCLDTARGKADSICSNPRFKVDGLRHSGEVASASFVTLDQLGHELSRWFGLLALAEQVLPDASRPQVLRSVLALLDRLSLPVQKLDFYASSASVTTFDGRTWQTRRATTYQRALFEPEAP